MRNTNNTKKIYFIFLIIFLIISVVVIGYNNRNHIRNYVVNDNLYSKEITFYANKYNIDDQLVRALIFQESKFDKDCKGSAGEIGLMQILPGKLGAVAEWGRKTKNPVPSDRELYKISTNLDIGCWYLSEGLKRWQSHKDKIALALAYYNAGPSRAKKWSVEKDGKNIIERIDINSTKNYVKSIIDRYNKYNNERKK